MNRSQVPRRRARRIFHLSNEALGWVKSHEVISGTIAWLVATILDSLIFINHYLDKPFLWIGKWAPKNPFLNGLQFTLFLLLYFGTIILTWKLIRRILLRPQSQVLHPTIMYEDELAAAAIMLDDPKVTATELRGPMEDLMFTIAETITTVIGISPKYYRAYFVVSNGGATDISGFRIGRQFHLADKRGSPIDDILQSDAPVIDRVLHRDKTISVMREVQEEFPDSDVYQMLSVRNLGNFRLAFCIANLDPRVDFDENDETFLQTSYIIRTLGFIDNLVDYVIHYE